MKTFNVGIIGYGGFGKFLHNAWRQMDNVRVVAIADLNADKLQNLESISVFANWRDLIRQENIDLVAIVTEPSTHETMAKACMEAGKNVLIEKPLALLPDDARRIMEARDKTRMVAATDFIMRFNPLLQYLQQLTQAGIFGQLRRVAVENYAQDEQLPLEHWFWDTARSGGILVEHAVHFIDLVHFLQPNKVLAVNGLKHNRNERQEDQIMANVLYEGGLIATHYHAFSRPGFFEKTKIKLAYDLADLELNGWIPLQGELTALVNQETKASLLQNPFFKLTRAVPIEEAADESRPKGWGLTSTANRDPSLLSSGGILYKANEMVSGLFDLGRSKQEVYMDCVQASLQDVLDKISNPAHQLVAPLEAGLKALEVATLATFSARNAVP
ncbi:MAG: Gfo/Idh/MocA family oxidoreductase [Saprospiraceae bacterium]|nr:Gfo/Idh/MocA family oxidoreductase [Saprospiraceae bacterium]